MTTVLVLKTIQWITIAVIFFLMVYAAMQKPSAMQRHVIFLMVSSILMLFGSMIKWDATNIDTAMAGAAVAYLGKPFIMLSAYMMISSFYGHVVPKRAYLCMCVTLTIIPILVYTNSYHHLYYATTYYDPTNPYSPLGHTNGPLYSITTISIAVFAVSSLIVVINGYMKSKSPVKRRLTIYSVLMLLSANGGFLVYVLKLTNGYDSTMMGICIGAIFMCILFFRCRIFDIVDKSKDYALDISPIGLAVFDDSNTIVYKNSAADNLVDSVIPKEYIDKLPDGEKVCNINDDIYSINVKTISNGNDYLGKSAEIQNITDAYNYKVSLEKAVKETTDRLSHIQRTIFGSLASVVEARSLETGDHIRRVSDYSQMIAQTLRDSGLFSDILTDDYIESLALSSPLHDIGKVAVKDSILLKPGKLTTEEFEEIKKHSAVGAEIIQTTLKGLESEEYIDMAADIAKYHHERIDGKGYPCGLKGDDIPLSARIVAVADCYDAITSKRCYKDAIGEDEAQAIMKEESGTHFDLVIVDAFLKGLMAHKVNNPTLNCQSI